MPMVKLLLERDPSMAYRWNKEGPTPPLLAATTLNPSYQEAIDTELTLPLLAAILNPSYLEAIEAMLKYCPEFLEECDRFGNTVLHLMTPLCNEIGIDTTKKLMRLFRFPPIIALKNKRNNDGNTPAHIAIKNHNVELIAMLIKSSANLAIKNKKGVSAATMILQCSVEFRTLVKKKIDLMDKEDDDSFVSVEDMRKMGFSIERIKKSEMLHKTTRYGNILHSLLWKYPDDKEDNEVRKFIKQLLSMAPPLICQLNEYGKTALHVIAEKRPSLIDEDFRKKIERCYKQHIKEEEDVEELCYDPPWTLKDKQGNTILHIALRKHWPAPWMYEILKFDYDFANQVNNMGELPLHVLLKTVRNTNYNKTCADKVDVTRYVTYMVSFNFRACNITDKQGLTPLLIAAQAKEFECFNKLLYYHAFWHGRSDCDIKTTYDGDPGGNTFWHHLAQVHNDAVKFDHIGKARCYNARKALTQRNNSGKTPFHIAIENGNFKVAYMYFSKILSHDERRFVYKDMGDNNGNVPLHLVVGQSNSDYAQEFIKDATTSTELIAVKNNMGITPLHLAVLKQDVQFLIMIFDIKRDDKEFIHQILQITDRDHNTLLHYAISQGAFLYVDKLLDEGINAECIDKILDMPNKDGNAPLHLAVLNGHSSLTRKFTGIVKDEAFIQGMLDKQNNDGNTALHLSVLYPDVGIADRLLKTAKESNYIQGILANCNNEGNTPLHLAIMNRQFNFVQCFIEVAIEYSCIENILDKRNKKGETPTSLIGSATDLPIEFEKFIWNRSKVVKAMLGLSGGPPKMIKEYTNMIGVIAALLATITFTAGFTVPGGLNSNNGTPLLVQEAAFQVFMVSDIIAMCLSMMVLFVLMWFMTIDNVEHQKKLLDLIVFLLRGAIYSTLVTFMTGLYASVFPRTHWIATFACVLCSLIILLIPSFDHIYVRYKKVYSLIENMFGLVTCCCFRNNQNNGEPTEPSEASSHANEPTENDGEPSEASSHANVAIGDPQTVVNIEPNN